VFNSLGDEMNEMKSIVLKQYTEKYDYGDNGEEDTSNIEEMEDILSQNYEEANYYSPLHEVIEEE
jgi:hypothetical protein